MLEQILAMFGLEPRHVDQMKAAAADFGVRFAALEIKVNEIHAAVIPAATPAAISAPVTTAETSPHVG